MLSVPSTGLWVVNLTTRAMDILTELPFSTLYGPMGGEPEELWEVAVGVYELSVPSTGLWVVNPRVNPNASRLVRCFQYPLRAYGW